MSRCTIRRIETAVFLGVLAVALLGFRHLAIARGARTIPGVFIAIAVTMASWADEREGIVPPVIEPQANSGAREVLPEAEFDPYAGASLRQDSQF